MGLDLSSCPFSLPENYNCLEISGKKMIFGSGMDLSNMYIHYYDPDSLDTNGPDLNFSGLDLPNSIFHGVTITIDVLETNPETLRIYSLRSFGESFYHSFTDASLEFGYKNL